MTKIVLPLLVVCGAMLLGAASAAAGGPPVFKEKVFLVNEPFVDDPGINCTNGLATRIEGLFTGVVRTVVRSDGTTRVRTTGGGTTTLDDYNPVPDGMADATSEFRSNAVDVFFGNAAERHRFALRGTVTSATGLQARFVVVYAVVIAPDGTVKFERERLRCE
jgi:hypothetical protein